LLGAILNLKDVSVFAKQYFEPIPAQALRRVKYIQIEPKQVGEKTSFMCKKKSVN